MGTELQISSILVVYVYVFRVRLMRGHNNKTDQKRIIHQLLRVIRLKEWAIVYMCLCVFCVLKFFLYVTINCNYFAQLLKFIFMFETNSHI